MRLGITTFGGDGGTSGISRYIIKLIEELTRLPDPPEMEALVFEDERDIFIPDGSRVEALTFKPSLRNPLLNIAWHQTVLPRLCRKRGYDVIFLPAGNRRLPYRAPCVSAGTVHDFSQLHVEQKYDAARMFFVTRVLPICIRRLDVIFTVSESSKRDIVSHCRVPEEKVIVTPNGVDHAAYYPRNAEEALSRMREKYGMRAPNILYVSRIEHPGKNHVNLIHAFNLLRERLPEPRQLVLAGGDWSRSDEVHALASQSPYAEDILFTGFVRGQDLPDLYSAASMFVFPSLYEGFGMPIIEAMACGAPVACSNVSSMPEVAGDAALLFDPANPQEIADTMERLITDARLRDECVRKGFEQSARFTWSHAAALTYQAMRSAWEASR
jgi:glycosyltransferase involved in cell wall biosynthesis